MRIIPRSIVIRKPINTHVHVREVGTRDTGNILASVIPFTKKQFSTAVAMGNTRVPITTAALAKKYKEDIRVNGGGNLHVIVALKLVQKRAGDPEDGVYSTPEVIEDAFANDYEVFKWYPIGTTTNAHTGVFNIRTMTPQLEIINTNEGILLVHAEASGARPSSRDHQDIAEMLALSDVDWVYHNFRRIRISIEHVSMTETITYIRERNNPERLVGSITPQHMWGRREHVWLPSGSFNPHCHCKPALKGSKHQQAVYAAPMSGEPFWMLGTDSAPHPASNKIPDESAAAFGCFNEPTALARYLEMFEDAESLAYFDTFAYENPSRFYQLQTPIEEIEFQHYPHVVREQYPIEGSSDVLIPWDASRMCRWLLNAHP